MAFERLNLGERHKMADKKDKQDSGKEKPKGKGKKKPESKEKQSGEGKGVQQLVRLSGVVVDGSLTLPKALMKVKGVGPRVADALIPQLGIPADERVGNLSEEQIADVEGKLEKIHELLPEWMLNRRKDVDTGMNLHKFGPELDMQKREDINREKKIKSYRGVRHSLNLPVRGQRTRSSFRTGGTLGVSRKKVKSGK